MDREQRDQFDMWVDHGDTPAASTAAPAGRPAAAVVPEETKSKNVEGVMAAFSMGQR